MPSGLAPHRGLPDRPAQPGRFSGAAEIMIRSRHRIERDPACTCIAGVIDEIRSIPFRTRSEEFS